jgi:hypothetical protein
MKMQVSVAVVFNGDLYASWLKTFLAYIFLSMTQGPPASEGWVSVARRLHRYFFKRRLWANLGALLKLKKIRPSQDAVQDGENNAEEGAVATGASEHRAGENQETSTK